MNWTRNGCTFLLSGHPPHGPRPFARCLPPASRPHSARAARWASHRASRRLVPRRPPSAACGCHAGLLLAFCARFVQWVRRDGGGFRQRGGRSARAFHQHPPPFPPRPFPPQGAGRGARLNSGCPLCSFYTTFTYTLTNRVSSCCAIKESFPITYHSPASAFISGIYPLHITYSENITACH
jgi:hypothetical protein